jgi:hypothetical protein
VLLPRLQTYHSAVRRLHRHRLRLPVPADHEAHRAPHRHILQHPPQLVIILHQLSIHLQNHIMQTHPGLTRRPVMVEIGDLRASCFLQLQRPKLVLAHVAHIDPEIPLRRMPM